MTEHTRTGAADPARPAVASGESIAGDAARTMTNVMAQLDAAQIAVSEVNALSAVTIEWYDGQR
jgi:hypothetical protein